MSVIIKALKRFLNDNKPFFIISVLFFVAGLIIGTFYYVNLSAENLEQISGYFEGIKNVSALDFGAGFIRSALRYMFFAAFMWLCGLMYFGSVLSPLPIALIGFTSAFSVSSLYNLYNGRGIMIAALTTLPICIFTIPVMLVFSVYTMRRSLQFSIRTASSGFVRYTMICIFLSLFLFACAFFDSYIASYIMINMF